MERGSLEANRLPKSSRDRSSCQRLWVERDCGLLRGKRQRISAVTRISELPSDRRASHGAREYMSREKPQQLIPVMRCLMLPRPSDGHRTTISKSGVSRGAPILCPRRDQWRPLSFPVRQSDAEQDRKSTRLNSSHGYISYAVFCLKKKK